MKIVILGSGVIGVTAAYMLGARGHQVEVIERRPESACESSFSNGGQLSYSHAEPWATPSVLPKIAKWIFKKDAPLVIHPRADLSMITWGLRFLRNCGAARSQANSVNLLKLGLYSKKKMEQLRVFSGIKFDNRRDGILHILSEKKELDLAIRQARVQEKFGCPSEIVDAARCMQLEPMLEHAGRTVIGGVLLPLDESGDTLAFTRELAKLAAGEYKAVFHYNTTVRKINVRSGQVVSVTTDKGEHAADAYIISLGSYSPLVLKPLGIRMPVYPMKGYSVTFAANHYAPSISLTDGENKIVFTRLGDKLRIAGMAEFAGYDDSIQRRRVASIVRLAQEFLPKCELKTPLQEWACLRPSTPDGPPIIGKTRYPNLYLNTGHGTLGWTQAAGSAALITDVIENRPTEISLGGLTLDRY